MEWLETKVETPEAYLELVTELFAEIGVESVSVEDPAALRRMREKKDGWDYIEDALLEAHAKPSVTGYILVDGEQQTRLSLLREKLNSAADALELSPDAFPIHTSRQDEENWMENWKQYYHPQTIGRRLLVKPCWEETDNPEDRAVVELDPGMAFGTGTHETTRLCLQQVERWLRPGDSVLDVGCGTGILAIAALKLGASHAVAVDIDSVAVSACRQNAALNRILPESLDILRGDLVERVPARGFRLVTANIVQAVLLRLLPDLPPYLEDGGVLILSGIIESGIEEMEQALRERGFEVLDVSRQGEWAAIAARRIIA